MAPEGVTTAEVLDRMRPEDGDIRELFALADESRYSGHKLGSADFARWMRVVQHRLVAKRAA
jgi:hypothetical protein